MIRMLMTGAAVAAVLANGAFAQDASSSAMDSSMMSSSSMSMDSSSSVPMDSMSSMDSSMMDSSMMSSQMSDASSMESSMMPATDTTATLQPRTPITILEGYSQVDTDQLATKIIGQPVYDGPAGDADNLGNINDLVLNGNGDVAAVVIGVGGFLGLGEKQVAVDFTALQVVVADDGTKRFVVNTTKEELTNAPDFTTVDKSPSEAVSDMSMSAEPASSAIPDATTSSSAMDTTSSSSAAK